MFESMGGKQVCIHLSVCMSLSSFGAIHFLVSIFYPYLAYNILIITALICILPLEGQIPRLAKEQSPLDFKGFSVLLKDTSAVLIPAKMKA